MMLADCYRILGIERTASANQIKQAYRKLVHKYHPDISADPRSEEKFKEIVVAYETLKNSAARVRCARPSSQINNRSQANNKRAQHIDIFV